MQSFLKSIKVKWIDIFLLVFAIFGTLIVLEQNKVVFNHHLITLSHPFYLFVIYYILMIASWIAFMFLS